MKIRVVETYTTRDIYILEIPDLAKDSPEFADAVTDAIAKADAVSSEVVDSDQRVEEIV